VIVDPGRAFGTGAHPTTRACIELLARLERGSVLDAGCGSGVLALGAIRLGFGPVHAVDVDEAAVEATRANAARNGIELEALQADALADPLPAVDVLVANIELRAVELLLVRALAERAVTSGYLADERPAAEGWSIADVLELEGWSAHVLDRV
jgi:ribosomal protein L11 methyltransferase